MLGITPSSGIQDQSWDESQDDLSQDDLDLLDRETLSVLNETQEMSYMKTPPTQSTVVKEEFPAGQLASAETLNMHLAEIPVVQGSVFKAVVQDLQQQEGLLGQLQS